MKIAVLHRELIGAACAGWFVDHKNGDTLDCRRANLRLADRSGNSANRRKQSSQSGYRGVRFDKRCGLYYGAVSWRGQRYQTAHYFENAVDAARARDILAIEKQGEFAKLNFGAAVGDISKAFERR